MNTQRILEHFFLPIFHDLNVVENQVYSGQWTISFCWSLTCAEHAWHAPLSETDIALLQDNFDRLIGGEMHCIAEKCIGRRSDCKDCKMVVISTE